MKMRDKKLHKIKKIILTLLTLSSFIVVVAFLNATSR